jgi:hypothetical protein
MSPESIYFSHFFDPFLAQLLLVLLPRGIVKHDRET